MGLLTYNRAKKSPQWSLWAEVMQSEFSSLRKYETWALLPRSEVEGSNVITVADFGDQA